MINITPDFVDVPAAGQAGSATATVTITGLDPGERYQLSVCAANPDAENYSDDTWAGRELKIPPAHPYHQSIAADTPWSDPEHAQDERARAVEPIVAAVEHREGGEWVSTADEAIVELADQVAARLDTVEAAIKQLPKRYRRGWRADERQPGVVQRLSRKGYAHFLACTSISVDVDDARVLAAHIAEFGPASILRMVAESRRLLGLARRVVDRGQRRVLIFALAGMWGVDVPWGLYLNEVFPMPPHPGDLEYGSLEVADDGETIEVVRGGGSVRLGVGDAPLDPADGWVAGPRLDDRSPVEADPQLAEAEAIARWAQPLAVAGGDIKAGDAVQIDPVTGRIVKLRPCESGPLTDEDLSWSPERVVITDQGDDAPGEVDWPAVVAGISEHARGGMALPVHGWAVKAPDGSIFPGMSSRERAAGIASKWPGARVCALVEAADLDEWGLS